MKNLPPGGLGFIEPLEARIAPAVVGNVDLSLTIDSIKMPDVAVPGDTGSITYTIHNNDVANTFHSDHLDVNLWLSKESGPFPFGYQSNPFFVAKYQFIKNGTPDINATIAPNGKMQRVEKFTMPDLNLGAPVGLTGATLGGTYNLTPGTGYHVIAEVDGAFRVDPFLHDNNSAASATTFEWEYQFGNVGTRKGVEMDATDPDGTHATFKLTGSGTGEAQLFNIAGTGSSNADLMFNGTDASGVASVITTAPKTGGDKFITLRDITSLPPLAELKMANADVKGSVIGNVVSVQLHNIGGSGHVLNVGGGKPATIILNNVDDLSIEASAGIELLQVAHWHKAGGTNNILTPFITTLKVVGDGTASHHAGDFEPDVTLTGADAKGNALGVAMINGKLQNASWQVNSGKIGTIAMDSANAWKLNASSTVAKLDCNGNFITDASAQSIKALSFDTISVDGKLTAYIEATGADDKGVAIEKLAASSVVGSKIAAAGGGITKIDLAGDWTGGGFVLAKWIGTLQTHGLANTTGDFNAQLLLTGDSAGKHPTLDKASIAHSLYDLTPAGGSFSWTIDGKINSLAAFSVSDSWSLGTDKAGASLGKLTVGALDGALTLTHFDTAVLDSFSGRITAKGDPSHLIKSIKLLSVSGATLDTDAVIKSITAFDWNKQSGKDSTINAAAIGTFKVRGQVERTNITLNGDLPLSLGVLSATTFNYSQLHLTHNAGQVIVKQMINSTVDAVNATIGSLKVVGNFASLNFESSKITANTITTLVISDVLPNDNADYGVTADKIANYTHKEGGDIVKHLTKLDAPGTLDTTGSYKLVIK